MIELQSVKIYDFLIFNVFSEEEDDEDTLTSEVRQTISCRKMLRPILLCSQLRGEQIAGFYNPATIN